MDSGACRGIGRRIPHPRIGALSQYPGRDRRSSASSGGEASVFAAAELHGATAITDDREAVRVARTYGLDVHGTIWLLAGACRDSKLPEPAAGNLIDALRSTGMRLPCTGAEFPDYARRYGLL